MKSASSTAGTWPGNAATNWGIGTASASNDWWWVTTNRGQPPEQPEEPHRWRRNIPEWRYWFARFGHPAKQARNASIERVRTGRIIPCRRIAPRSRRDAGGRNYRVRV